MDAIPTLEDPTRLFSRASVDELRARPGFRAACEQAAAEGVAHFLALGEDERWLFKDIGRSGICLTALILQSTAEGLTAQGLIAACRARNFASAGRVTGVIRRLERAGNLLPESDTGFWTRRRMRLSPAFVRQLQRRAFVELRAAVLLCNEAPAILAAVEDEGGFLRYAWHVGFVSAARPDLFHFAGSESNAFFMQREAGMLMLFDFIGAQRPGRERLLESAPLSRYALARRYGVSRAHLIKMLDDAAARGFLNCPSSDRVIFAPSLSDALERQFALLFQVSRAAGVAVLAARQDVAAASSEARFTL